MFQRINNRKDSDINTQEIDDESVHSGAGNEAALLNNLITNESNEANNNLIENLDQIPEENASFTIEGLDQIPDFSAGGDDDDLATTQAAKNLKINKLKKKKLQKNRIKPSSISSIT